MTTALDLSVALVEDSGRNPETAAEVRRLLQDQAARRGEGASIRLWARIMSDELTQADVYAAFADEIEARGDFIALLFALPHIPRDRVADYVDRAVSVMNCSSQDAYELAEALSGIGDTAAAAQWIEVATTMTLGNALSKLGLTNRQMLTFAQGAAPTEYEVYQRRLAEGDARALQSLYALAADPDLQTWNPEAAAEHLLAILAQGTAEGDDFALQRLALADPAIRDLVEDRVDVIGIYTRAAQRGDPALAYGLARLLQERAVTVTDLAQARDWMTRAAEGGEVPAMADLGRMLAIGLGGPADRQAALQWLDQAGRAGDAAAADLARLIRLQP